MNNYVQPGDVLTLTAPYAVASGEGALIGTNIFGVATAAVANGAVGEFKTTGVIDIKTKTTDTPSVGSIAYWDNTNKEVTTTSTSNTKIGVFVAAKSSGPTVGRVRLNGVFG